MATTRTAFWVFCLAVFALDPELTVSGATLNLTASDYGSVDEGSGLTLSCAVNGNISSSEWVYFDVSLVTSPSPSFSPVCYVVTAADQCYTSGPWNQCYCRTKSNSTYREYDIYIRDVKVDHACNWRCRLYYDKKESNYIRVDVNGRPTRPTLSPVSTSAGTGEDVTLTCSSQPTSMPADIRTSLEYTWRKEGVVLSGETGSTLVVQNVQSSHEGRYTCLARESGKNLSSEESNAVHVDVQYAPSSVTLSPSTSSYEVRETTGSVPNIRCQADCDPPCLFRWTDKGGNLVGGTGNELQLTSLRRDQSGMFTCSASNHLGHGDVQVNMTATYPPEVTLTQTEVRLEEGDNVTVLCHVDASPPAEVSWTKLNAGDNVTLQSSPLLELRRVGEGDAGLYTCSASNRLSPQQSPSQASLRVLVTSQQPAFQAAQAMENSELSWPAGLGIGIAVGLVFCALIAGLVFLLLLIRRKRRWKDMQREERAENSYENLDLSSRRDVRDNATYQQFNVYENQDFVLGEDLIRDRQARGGQGNESQTEAGAAGQSQDPRAGNRLSKAEERQGRSSRVEGASSGAEGRSSSAEGTSSGAEDKENRRSKAAEKANRRSASQDRETWRSKAEGSEDRRSKANGTQGANVQESNGRLSGAAQTDGRKSTAAKKEEGKKGGKNQGKEEEERNGEVRDPPIMAEPFYMNTTM